MRKSDFATKRDVKRSILSGGSATAQAAKLAAKRFAASIEKSKVETVNEIIRRTPPVYIPPDVLTPKEEAENLDALGFEITGMACPICMESFPLKNYKDKASWNIAGYEIHLRNQHNIFLPKPITVRRQWRSA